MERTGFASPHPVSRTAEPVDWHPPLGDRVRAHTSRKALARIDQETKLSLDRHARGSLLAMLRRLHDLDREWDLDRWVMVGFAGAAGASAALSLWQASRRGRPGPFTAVLAAQLCFLAFHAVRGWAPPVALLRRLGVRTRQEIEAERYALEQLLDQRLAQ
jgi:hypothetical protein